jgi:hypothetical protein
MRRQIIERGVALALLFAGTTSATEKAPQHGSEIEQFLRTARVVDREPLSVGVTHSERLTLSDGSETHRAVWKTIDDTAHFKRFARGLPEIGFRDTYKNELAAYELSKLLDLEIVPPTVERRLGRHRGSVQLWIENCMTEAERYKSGVQPPDSEAWLRQVYTERAFRQLTYDTDFRNASNVLVDCDFRLWSIDHSRAFRTQSSLLDSEYLKRFSIALLARLRDLNAENLQRTLGSYLSKAQRNAILARRDLILARAEELVDKEGEHVLYP